MNPARRTAKGGAGDARNRRLIAAKYLEVAELAATEEGAAANNVVVGVAVLAGIAHLGVGYCPEERGIFAGRPVPGAKQGRSAARRLVESFGLDVDVDRKLGDELSKLVRLKSGAHYGSKFIGNEDRTRALRAAATLVDAATERTLGA